MNDTTILEASMLSRSYTKRVKAEGLSAALRSLFKPVNETVRALSAFDFSMRQGEIAGLIGPNGAGKTTLVKILSGLIRPDSGELSVFGHKPSERKESFLKRISLVMGQKSQLWQDLPAMDSFLLNKSIYEIPEKRYRENLERLAARLEAGSLLETPVRNLSLGERMRVEFIAAMLHEPELVFLDEPSIGLDAPAQRQIREFLREENMRSGLSIILTSHYMEDIRKLCPRTILILGGKKAYDGPTEAMLASVIETKHIRVILEGDPPHDTRGIPGRLVESTDSGFVVSVDKNRIKEALTLILERFDVSDISIEEELAESVERLYKPGMQDMPEAME